MEPQDAQLESLDGDGTMSLHSSNNSSPLEQNEEAMDLFLTNVTDYNSQHFSYDAQHHTSGTYYYYFFFATLKKR